MKHETARFKLAVIPAFFKDQKLRLVFTRASGTGPFGALSPDKVKDIRALVTLPVNPKEANKTLMIVQDKANQHFLRPSGGWLDVTRHTLTATQYIQPVSHETAVRAGELQAVLASVTEGLKDNQSERCRVLDTLGPSIRAMEVFNTAHAGYFGPSLVPPGIPVSHMLAFKTSAGMVYAAEKGSTVDLLNARVFDRPQDAMLAVNERETLEGFPCVITTHYIVGTQPLGDEQVAQVLANPVKEKLGPAQYAKLQGFMVQPFSY